LIDNKLLSKCSFLIPSYNDNNELIKTLKSIESEKLSVLIVDDGSDIPVRNFIDINQYTCEIKILTLDKNQGIVSALNSGLSYLLDNGMHYVFRIDAGDINIPERVGIQLSLMILNDLILVGGHVEYFDDISCYTHYLPVNAKKIFSLQHMRSCFIHPGVVINLKKLEHSQWYASRYRHAEDYEFFLRLVKQFPGKVGNVDSVVVKCLVRNSGISLSNRRTQIYSVIKAQARHFSYTNLYSYIGIIKSVMLLIVPVRFVNGMKSLIRKMR
jgi:glycosyltransferase involved in cell wall biosynthesis